MNNYKITYDDKNREIFKEFNNNFDKVIIIESIYDGNDNIIKKIKEHKTKCLNYDLNEVYVWNYEYDNKNRKIFESSKINDDYIYIKKIEYMDNDLFPNLIKSTLTDYYTKNNITNTIKEINEYNEFGLITLYQSHRTDTGYIYFFENIYDENKNIKETKSNNCIEIKKYNNENKLIEIEEISEDYTKKINYSYIKQIHNNDEDKNILIKVEKECFKDINGEEEINTNIYHYDKYNNLIYYKTNEEEQEIYKYNENGNVLLYSYVDEVETFFNENGLEYKTINHSIDWTINYYYDELKNLIKREDSNGTIFELEYDNNNNILKEYKNKELINNYENTYLILEKDIIDFFNFDNIKEMELER